ncbi:uncharacterized protein EAE98_007632 [Botrytis deweyae]|uniref:Uncharacterized protein n=1 Tax=Botrytis deweyae TaxID=2478750 RepID=A0ABQ7IGV9_9HELO|nr:uncharacterized protein EAE98_007632 [Botrytis deweyae]KAF7923814.1 hypothetical protein EAE98_007632 [Botrytis deweyae]
MIFSKVHPSSQQIIKETVDANQDNSPYQLILVQRSAYSAGYQHQQQASAGQITNDGVNNQAP